MLRSRGRVGRWMMNVQAGGLAALMIPVIGLVHLPLGPGGGRAYPAKLLPVPAQRPVPVHVVRSSGIRPPRVRLWHAPRLSWPAPGTAVAQPAPASSAPSARHELRVARLAGPSAGSARAGSLPVWVGPVAGVAVAGGASRVRVRVLPR